MAEMNVAFDYDMYLLDRQNQNRRRVFERFDPRRTMPEAQIKKADMLLCLITLENYW